MSSRTSPPDHCLWCHGAAAPVQEVLRAILANWSFLVRFKGGPQLRGMVAAARKDSIFLHCYSAAILPKCDSGANSMEFSLQQPA